MNIFNNDLGGRDEHWHRRRADIFSHHEINELPEGWTLTKGGLAMTLWKLNDVRAALEEALGRQVSPSLVHYYTSRDDFPAPALVVGEKTPERVWDPHDVEWWLRKVASAAWLRERNM